MLLLNSDCREKKKLEFKIFTPLKLGSYNIHLSYTFCLTLYFCVYNLNLLWLHTRDQHFMEVYLNKLSFVLTKFTQLSVPCWSDPNPVPFSLTANTQTPLCRNHDGNQPKPCLPFIRSQSSSSPNKLTIVCGEAARAFRVAPFNWINPPAVQSQSATHIMIQSKQNYTVSN